MAFFPVATGELLRVTLSRSATVSEAASDLECYDVASSDGRALGQFVRLQVFASADATIDLALRFENERLVAAHALRPVMIGGQAMLGLPAFLGSLADRPVDGYAPELAALCESLAYLERASGATAAESVLSDETKRRIADKVSAEMPALAPGTPMPSFSAVDMRGETMSPARFLGKRALILAGRVQNTQSGQVMEWLRRYREARPGRFVHAEVLANSPEELSQWQARGGLLGGIAVADARGEVLDALRVPVLPAVLVFDRELRMVRHLEAPFESYEALAATLDAVE